jgi:hypothetical protein
VTDEQRQVRKRSGSTASQEGNEASRKQRKQRKSSVTAVMIAAGSVIRTPKARAPLLTCKESSANDDKRLAQYNAGSNAKLVLQFALKCACFELQEDHIRHIVELGKLDDDFHFDNNVCLWRVRNHDNLKKIFIDACGCAKCISCKIE